MTKLERIQKIIKLTHEKLYLLEKLEIQFMVEEGFWSMKLETCIQGMNLPEEKKRDIEWLNKNIQWIVLQNSKHPFAKLAAEEVRRLLATRALKTSENSSNT